MRYWPRFVIPGKRAQRARPGIQDFFTNLKNFWIPDFSSLAVELADKAIFDGRNLYEPDAVTPFGLRYFAIGRGERLD